MFWISNSMPRDPPNALEYRRALTSRCTSASYRTPFARSSRHPGTVYENPGSHAEMAAMPVANKIVQKRRFLRPPTWSSSVQLCIQRRRLSNNRLTEAGRSRGLTRTCARRRLGLRCYSAQPTCAWRPGRGPPRFARATATCCRWPRSLCCCGGRERRLRSWGRPGSRSGRLGLDRRCLAPLTGPGRRRWRRRRR
jgi:hypothetical protein